MRGILRTGVIQRIRGSLKGTVLATGMVLVATAGTLSSQSDRVILKTGKDRTVRIKSENFEGVWYGTGDTVIRWNEVDSIEYAGGESYQKALEALETGRVADAAGQLETLAADADLRPVLRQHVLFHLAVANSRLGKRDEALARYEDLLEAFPDSRWILPAGSSMLSLYLAKQDVPGAARALEPVLAAAKGGASAGPLQSALDILRGRLLEEQARLDEADRVYEEIARSPDAEPDVVLAAKLGSARCAQKRKQPADAEKRYRELATSDGPNALLAGAWNGLGDLALEQALSKRDPDGLRVALLSYLRGVVLYVPQQGEPSEELERSLAGAARTFQAIGELEGNAERKQLFLDRARAHKSQLAAQYPGSRFLVGL